MPTACLAKNLAQINFFLAQADAAATSDHDSFVVEGIVDVGQSGVDAQGTSVDVHRTSHVQRFVRALAVEDVDTFVKAACCCFEVQEFERTSDRERFWAGIPSSVIRGAAASPFIS